MLFPYSTTGKSLLPLKLTLAGTTVLTEGLLDSGSDVNVLPLGIGSDLGAQWDSRKTTLRLSGTFAGISAIPLLVMARVGDLAPVRLAFA